MLTGRNRPVFAVASGKIVAISAGRGMPLPYNEIRNQGDKSEFGYKVAIAYKKADSW